MHGPDKTNPKITAEKNENHGTVCNLSSIQFNYWTDMERGVGQHRVHPGKAEQGEENVQAANLAEFWILNLFFENSSFLSAGCRGIYILNMFLTIVFSSMWDTHHHHVPVVGCSFHLKSFTKWRLSPNWSHFGKYSTWLFFLSFQIANWVIKRNISFSPACYLDCSPWTQQYSKRIEMIKCLIIVFSQEIVLPNILTLTLMFDILIKRLRDVHI